MIDDDIGLWILYCSRAGLNVVISQHFLKICSNEFGSVVKNCSVRTWIATEPILRFWWCGLQYC